MENVLLAIHLIIALAIVAFVLLQKSEGGALGIGGRSDGLVSARGVSDFLSRTTTILAAIFFVTSLALAWVAQDRSLDDRLLDAAGDVTIETAPRAPIAPLAPVSPLAPTAPSLPAPPANPPAQ